MPCDIRYILLCEYTYVYLHVSLDRNRMIADMLDGLGVDDCVLAAKRTVCWFRATREEYKLSVHTAEPSYRQSE